MLQHTGYLKMTWTQLAPAQQDLVKYFLQRSVEVLSSCAPSAVGPKCVKQYLHLLSGLRHTRKEMSLDLLLKYGKQHAFQLEFTHSFQLFEFVILLPFHHIHLIWKMCLLQ